MKRSIRKFRPLFQGYPFGILFEDVFRPIKIDEFIPAEGNFFGSIQQLYQYRNLLAESGNPTFFDWVSQDIPSSKMLENGS